jgi:hypothetical protein
MGYLKDPTEKKDYAIDWTRLLADGETVIDSTWSVPVGMTKDDESVPQAITSVWLSGGTAGAQYRITNHITTVQGREFERSFTITVVDL